MARPEYTDEGLARQERLIGLTRFGAIAAFVLITLVGGVYFSLLKPMFYRNAVAKGRDMIMQRGASAIPDAERQFEKALSYYDKDTYAYLQYADAYRYKGLYEEAFSKLFAEVASGRSVFCTCGRQRNTFKRRAFGREARARSRVRRW
jgi:hypothetical protein